jgi:hypothetical protein
MAYSPILGRWLQQDPLAYVDGSNPYQYELSLPTASLDPLGTQALWWDPGFQPPQVPNPPWPPSPPPPPPPPSPPPRGGQQPFPKYPPVFPIATAQLQRCVTGEVGGATLSGAFWCLMNPTVCGGKGDWISLGPEPEPPPIKEIPEEVRRRRWLEEHDFMPLCKRLPLTDIPIGIAPPPLVPPWNPPIVRPPLDRGPSVGPPRK